jgi:hypothetical protein
MQANGLHKYDVAGTTVIHDMDRNEAIAELTSVLVLPVGSEVELVNPNINATVVRVRLLAAPTANDPVTVCLDVKVPTQSD